MEPDVNSAIRKGYFRQVRFLLQLGASPNCRDPEHRTPLMNCALIEDEPWAVGVARTLIEKGASMRSRDRDGLTALHHACLYGRRALTELLLRSPDFDINQADRHGNTPLHYAVMRGDENLVEVLLEAMDKYHIGLDKANNLGYTALMQSWRTDHEPCAKLLLSRGADATTIRDLVQAKTASDYEAEYRLRQLCKKEEIERRSRGFFANLSHQKRPVSAVSALSRSSRESIRVRTKNRPASSRLLARRPAGGRDHSTSGEPEVDYIQKVEKDRLAGRLIRSASLSDIRNKPEQLLNISPIEYFVNEPRYQRLNNRTPFGLYDENTNEDDSHNKNNATSWKTEMKKMYSAFQYQFTPSYRKPAQPPEPEVQEHLEEVASSPIPSELDVTTTERNKKNRKSSGKGLADEKQDKKFRKLSGRILTRKSSNVSLKSQQAVVDCSSNESLNSTKKACKKRGTENNIDLPEASPDKTTKTEKNGKTRSRKISSALDDHGAIADQSRGMNMPIVKESVGQDQLHAIRE